MTSLEALEEIRERFSDDAKNNNSWGFKIPKQLQTIKQDLEVLEIIKANKNIIFSKNPNYENMSADDFFKLSRWLEE